ncbi:hypothetical protein [Methanococcus voltae]|uniref:Uncharacterized protein n=1 Tax=Methanococcus voltae (strain ATCC BAA-1334 / A3) TaxID=456320 RepID=D7DRU6_METV3|nr:hypothetical protein [Methanococcus voltae]MCS3901174.1 hypothetical protein [Methanococcus voltae]
MKFASKILLKLGIVLIILILCIATIGYLSGAFFGVEKTTKTIVENSPYPEFAYVDKEVATDFINGSMNVSIPPSMLFFIDSVYINLDNSTIEDTDTRMDNINNSENSSNIENKTEIAIKTPLWFIGYLFAGDDVSVEDGYIFLNSRHFGKPDFEYPDYDLMNGDIIVYSKEKLIILDSNEKYNYMQMVFKNTDDYAVYLNKTKEQENDLFAIDWTTLGLGVKLNSSIVYTGNYVIETSVFNKSNLSDKMDYMKFQKFQKVEEQLSYGEHNISDLAFLLNNSSTEDYN